MEVTHTWITIEQMKTNFLYRAVLAGFVVISIFVALAKAQSPSPVPLTSAQVQRIQQLADTYGLDATAAAQKCQALFSPDRLVAGEAEWFFEQQKAYEILAVVLPSLTRDDPVHGGMIDTLVSKKTYSKPVFDALVAELDALNALPLEGGNELPGANQTVKEKICNAIAGWLNLQPPQITLSPDPVSTFSAQAKAKAALLTDSSPY